MLASHNLGRATGPRNDRKRLSWLEQPDVQRYLSIDVLRDLAIMLMIQVHFVENLSPRESSFGWLLLC